tara:strand:+ start:293 stop:529 length:237 start_codon:yes stop_codon:yes gene_type:complete
MKKTNGLGLGSVLLVVFVILKLVGTIDWSWVWVLSPAWISILLAGLAGGVLEVLKTIVNKRSAKRLEEYRKNKFNTKK